MKSSEIKIKVIIDLQEEGDTKLGYTLVNRNPKAYSTPRHDLIVSEKVTLNYSIPKFRFKNFSDIHSKNNELLLSNYFSPGDKVEVIYPCSNDCIGVAFKAIGIIEKIPDKNGWNIDICQSVVLKKGFELWIQKDYEETWISTGEKSERNRYSLEIHGLLSISTYEN